jgi:hypothetical protein
MRLILNDNAATGIWILIMLSTIKLASTLNGHVPAYSRMRTKAELYKPTIPYLSKITLDFYVWSYIKKWRMNEKLT